MKLRTFDQVIEHSEQFKKRHLLLGNGFSIACRSDIFTYGSLLDQAEFLDDSKVPELFKALGTTDFEKAIKFLEDTSAALSVYMPGIPVGQEMTRDAATLKKILIETVANNHPERPHNINDEQFWGCRQFLSHFLDVNGKGKVYTLSYDLLLYWALMHEDNEQVPSVPDRLAADDGFGRDEDTKEEYVDWLGESRADQQRVHYLHGALHLFDAGATLKKYTWVNTQEALIEQAQAAMDRNEFPLFVAEGTSDQKLAKIQHSAYLHHSYKSFSRQMEQKDDALFIFGHSLDDNDRHIMKKIMHGRIGQVYIGIYGDPDSDGNKQIKRAAVEIKLRRKQYYPVNIIFYDAESARVWEYQS